MQKLRRINNTVKVNASNYCNIYIENGLLADKKRSGNSIKLIIPEKMSECVDKKIPTEQLLDFIKAGL